MNSKNNSEEFFDFLKFQQIIFNYRRGIIGIFKLLS